MTSTANEAAGTLALHGPLGALNQRRQQGRSMELGTRSGKNTSDTLIFTGAPGKEADAIGDALASTLTISCTFDPLDTPPEAMPIVRGRIRWGSDGHQAEALFDWKRGTVLHVCGSAAELSAELLEGSFNDESYVRVGAFLGYNASTRQSATLTERAAIPAGAAGPVIPVAAFAARVHIASDTLGTTWNATLVDDAGGVLALYTQATFAGGGSVPIPNGAAGVVVTSTAAAFAALVVFELSI